MMKIAFRGTEHLTGRSLMEHTYEEADRVCDFINEVVFLPEKVRQAITEGKGGLWPKKRLTKKQKEPASLLAILAKEWFYSNVKWEVVVPAPNCRPVLQVIW